MAVLAVLGRIRCGFLARNELRTLENGYLESKNVKIGPKTWILGLKLFTPTFDIFTPTFGLGTCPVCLDLFIPLNSKRHPLDKNFFFGCEKLSFFSAISIFLKVPKRFSSFFCKMSPCHYNHVDPLRVNDPWFIPLTHLTSYEYARYLYKWKGYVRIHYGDMEEWGNWGTRLNANVADFFFKVLDFEDDYVLLCAAALVGEDQAVLVQPEATSFVWSRYLRPYRSNTFPLQLDWHHPREEQVSTANFVHFPVNPFDDYHQQIIISGAFPFHNNWHQI